MGATGIVISSGGANPPQELPITQGTDLGDWEKGIRNNDYETGVLVDKDGIPVKAYKGGEHSVQLPPSILQNPAYEGATFTHNHPNDKFGGTFSAADIKVFTQSNWGEMRAVSKDGTTYILRATKNSDRAKLEKWLKGKQKLYQRNFNLSYTAALTRAKDKLGMTDAQADKYARQYAVGRYNKRWAENLKKFGFDYVVKKGSTSTNRPNTGTGYLTK